MIFLRAFEQCYISTLRRTGTSSRNVGNISFLPSQVVNEENLMLHCLQLYSPLVY